MKTIGIIGGLGPQATMDFVAKIHQVSQKLIPQNVNVGYPPLFVYYYRHFPMVINKDGSIPEILKPDPRLLEVAKQVGEHSDFLVMASNTPHFFQKEIEQASDRKILSMVDVTLEEIKKRELKKVGIIALGATSRHRLYQDPLDQLGVDWEELPNDLAEELDKSIFSLMEGENLNKINKSAKESVQYLREKNVEATILGCTETPLLLEKDLETSDIINPAQLLAEAAVKYAID